MAVVTAEWTLVGVDHLMSMEILQKCESSATSLALMWSGLIT